MKVDQGHVSIGSVVGLYRIARSIASNRGSGLFEGQHLLLETKVTLKVLGPELAGSPEALDRFLADAKSAARATHENVAKVLDVGRRADGFAYVAMEFLDGTMLAGALREEPLPWPRAKRIALQIAAGLGAAHALGIVHGDLNPENAFLVRRGEQSDVVKLIGFGAAKALAAPGLALKRLAPSGTRNTTAPEQVDGKPIDVRTDIYALGALLYEMLTGGPMFADRRARTTPDRRLVDVPPPSVRRPDLSIPAAADAIILRALEVDPARRWPDTQAMSHAMELIPDWPAAGVDIGPEEVTPILPLASIQAWTGQSGEIAVPKEEMTPEPDFEIKPLPPPPAVTPRTGVPTGATAAAMHPTPPGGSPERRSSPSRPAIPIVPPGPARDSGSVHRKPTVPVVITPEMNMAVGAGAAKTGGRMNRWVIAVALGLVGAVVIALVIGRTEKPPAPELAPGPTMPGKPVIVAVGAGAPAPSEQPRPPQGAAPGGGAPEIAPEITQLPSPSERPAAAGTPARPLVRRPPVRPLPGARPGAPAAGAAAQLRPAAPAPEAPPAVALATPPVARAAEGNCSVTLGSRPGSDVWVDGERIGATPLVARSLPCGRHKLLFREEDQGLEREETVVLQPGQLLKRTVDLGRAAPVETCSITLGSTPWAEAFIDGRRAGTTPLVKYALPCGKHEIVLRNPELQLSWRETVQLKAGELLRRVVTLDAER